jgi:hypothetical protein
VAIRQTAQSDDDLVTVGELLSGRPPRPPQGRRPGGARAALRRRRGRTAARSCPLGSCSCQSSYRFPANTRHEAPQPIVTTTSVSATVSDEQRRHVVVGADAALGEHGRDRGVHAAAGLAAGAAGVDPVAGQRAGQIERGDAARPLLWTHAYRTTGRSALMQSSHVLPAPTGRSGGAPAARRGRGRRGAPGGRARAPASDLTVLHTRELCAQGFSSFQECRTCQQASWLSTPLAGSTARRAGTLHCSVRLVP